MARGIIRKPSFWKIVGAYRSQWKRTLKRMFIPGYGRRGMGWWRNPKKAWYNWWYYRTSSYEYRLTHRGGGGFTNIKLGGKNTAVAGSFPVENDQDVIMVTNGGKIIRTPVADVRIAGRSTAGVTLFRTADNEKVVSAISIEGAGTADEQSTTETTENTAIISE